MTRVVFVIAGRVNSTMAFSFNCSIAITIFIPVDLGCCGKGGDEEEEE